MQLTVCSYPVTCAFQKESTIYSCLNSRNSLLKAGAKLSDCNWTRNHNSLVHKRTLNHLVKLAKVFVYGSSGYGFESSCKHSITLCNDVSHWQ